MNNIFSRIFSSSSTDPTRLGKPTLWQKLVEPPAVITEPAERRQVSLVSAMLLILALTMISGVVYMGFFSPSPIVGFVLAGSDIVIWITYFLSRTRHHQLAAFIALIVLAIIPILNVGLTTDHSSEALLILLIWNVLTILLSSAITSARNTVLFAIINILTFVLLPVFVPSVTFKNITMPLIFNSVQSVTIAIFTLHRNLMERDRLNGTRQAA